MATATSGNSSFYEAKPIYKISVMPKTPQLIMQGLPSNITIHDQSLYSPPARVKQHVKQ